MAAKYTTEAKVAAFLDETIATGAATAFIESAEALIDQITGRNFKADTAASAKLFDGNDEQDLSIDDCVAVTKVEVGSNFYGDSHDEVVANDAVGAGSDCYYKLPNNALVNGQPIIELHLRSRIWVEGMANHRITAKWGYSVSAPKDIEFAATVLAGGMYIANRLKNGEGAVKSESIGGYSITYDSGSESKWNDYDAALKILDRYKKYSF